MCLYFSLNSFILLIISSVFLEKPLFWLCFITYIYMYIYLVFFNQVYASPKYFWYLSTFLWAPLFLECLQLLRHFEVQYLYLYSNMVFKYFLRHCYLVFFSLSLSLSLMLWYDYILCCQYMFDKQRKQKITRCNFCFRGDAVLIWNFWKSTQSLTVKTANFLFVSRHYSWHAQNLR